MGYINMGVIRTFKEEELGSGKELLKKMAEEWGETYSAWEKWNSVPNISNYTHLQDELSDILQAVGNMLEVLHMYNIDDANLRCEQRNLLRNKYDRGEPPYNTDNISDGFHTFGELYHHRTILFSVIVNEHPDISWKSRLHADGTMYDDMFIVGINTPAGEATYHCDIAYWNLFNCKEIPNAPDYDGYSSYDTISRLESLVSDQLIEETYDSASQDGLYNE